MTDLQFNKLHLKLENYRFTSMNYIDYSDVSDYQIVQDQDNIILLHGFHKEAQCYEYHWAANSSDDILSNLKNDTPCLITFIPDEWVEAFNIAGFTVRDAWHDYFMHSLASISDIDSVEFLSEDECEEASKVTLSCIGQSRGFTGQTTDWIREWITGSDQQTRNNAILIERNENKEIVGIICVGTYAHESEKGAIVWIREIAVKPDYQRKGIARKLMNQALAYGKSFGAKRAFLAADECNKHAIHLYEQIGFKASQDSSQIDMVNF